MWNDITNTELGVRYPDRFYIGGKWVGGSSDRQITLINPANESIVGSVAEAIDADVDAAVAAAREAFDDGPWPRMRPAERAAIMLAMVDHLRARTIELAHAWTRQIGAPHHWAQGRTAAAINYYAFCANLAESFAWEEDFPSSFAGYRSLLIREPVGVVAAIVPWNAPFQTMAMKVAPALIAGCTVIVKPSPETPLEAYILAEAAEAAGLPPGVLNVVTADRGSSEHLVRNPGVDKVSFTGSSVAGKAIGAICAERVARATLELGGKSAAIVLEDYDIDAAATTLASTVSMLSGQVCSNLTRLLIPASSHDRFVDAMADRMKHLAVGDPYDPATQVGPLASKRQFDRVEHYIKIGAEEGAKLVTGGSRPDDQESGYFFAPTLFANVDNGSTIAQEEIFGPVACVIPYRDLDEAIGIANASPFGLSGSVFTHDAAKALSIARRVRTGTVGQNGSKTELLIGYGGFKQSGIGREGGIQGLHNYLEAKTVTIADER